MPPVALDEHLHHALGEALRRASVDVVHISDWQGQRLRTKPDEVILAATTEAGRVLITRDSRTFPRLAYQWAAEGRHHAGLIVLPKSIPQPDIGAALDAILRTISGTSTETFANTVTYAQRSR